MGEARRRGTYDERVAEAHKRAYEARQLLRPVSVPMTVELARYGGPALAGQHPLVLAAALAAIGVGATR